MLLDDMCSTNQRKSKQEQQLDYRPEIQCGGQPSIGLGCVVSAYVPSPKELPGFPEAKPSKPKTPVQGGGGLRKRWKDSNGTIYEWDSRHGTVEKYDRRGRHLGEFDPNTAEPLKDADRSRRVEP